jgi:hypothetical protein
VKRLQPTVAAVTAAAVLAAAAIAAGCGGDSSAFTVQADTTIKTNDSLTKAEFLEQANAVCMRNWHVVVDAFRAKSADLRSSQPQMSDGERFAEATGSAYLPNMESYIVAEIQDLGAPPRQEQAVEELIGSMQEAIEQGRLDPATSRAEILAAFSDYNRRASRYGLVECRLVSLTLPPE